MKSTMAQGSNMLMGVYILAVLLSFYPMGFAAAVVQASGISLTGVDSVSVAATTGGGYEHGWKWIYHFTVPQKETLFKMKFSNFTSGGNTIPAAGNIRIFTPQSQSNTAESSAVLISAADTFSDVITLSDDANSGATDRQIDVTVEVQVPSGTAGGAYAATYDVESDVPPDTQAPVIALTPLGTDIVELIVGDNYTEEGAIATDNVDGTDMVVIDSHTVDTSTAGTYTVTYNAVDAAGNHATQVTRTVNVAPGGPPPACPPFCFDSE